MLLWISKKATSVIKLEAPIYALSDTAREQNEWRHHNAQLNSVSARPPSYDLACERFKYNLQCSPVPGEWQIVDGLYCCLGTVKPDQDGQVNVGNAEMKLRPWQMVFLVWGKPQNHASLHE